MSLNITLLPYGITLETRLIRKYTQINIVTLTIDYHISTSLQHHPHHSGLTGVVSTMRCPQWGELKLTDRGSRVDSH